ncbi:response regulator [candidate division KSB1 bacterium]|nr:response regulator [candidate division KSB1 bacterium]
MMRVNLIFDYFDAYDGTTGYSLILEEMPDLIILDIKMPSLSGLEVLKKIRTNTDSNISKIPVIMLTAASDSETVQTAIEQGASNYLLKPFQKTALISRVNKILKL